jgi:glycosyltransferase involved in cell wall biosynthesis
MIIGFNARRLVGQRLGIGRYIEYITTNWSKMLEPDERVKLFVREPFDTREFGLSDRFEVEHLRPKLHGFVWENALLAPAAKKECDVLFCPNYMLPFTYGRKSVVVIHSANEVWPGTHEWWYRYTYTPTYKSSCRRATRVIVVSESTSEDVQACYGIPAEKIDIVPPGADDVFRPLDDEAALRAARLKWLGADRPFIVWVGKLSQRRNIPILLEAFARLKRSRDIPHALLLFGPNHLGLPLERLTRELGIADDVVQTDGTLERHSDLVPVYNAADAFVSASSYEGFSLTMVEAMACGTPVVAVNRAAQREIVDGAGMLIDDATPELLAEAMGRVLNEPSLAEGMRSRGVERARHFRWENTARETLDVLRKVAHS